MNADELRKGLADLSDASTLQGGVMVRTTKRADCSSTQKIGHQTSGGLSSPLEVRRVLYAVKARLIIQPQDRNRRL